MGLRLQLLKAQAEAGDIVLLYGDESEALTHPDLARAGPARRRPACAGAGAGQEGGDDGVASITLSAGSSCRPAGPSAAATSSPICSNSTAGTGPSLGGDETRRAGRGQRPDPCQQDHPGALEARKHWPTVEWLPKYAPELNDIEVVWHDIKVHHLAHQTFTDVEALDREIDTAVDALNSERNVDRWSTGEFA